MGMEENALQVYRKEKTVTKTATATLKPNETNVKVNCAAGAVTISLPTPALCRGKVFAIHQVEASNNVTINDGSASVDWPGNITLNALNDRALLFCDGECWWIICDMYT